MPIVHEADGAPDEVANKVGRTGFGLFPPTRGLYQPSSHALNVTCLLRKLTQSPLGQHNPTLLPEFIQPPLPAAGAAGAAEG